MDQRLARTYDEFERDYWWFVGRRKVISTFLGRYLTGEDLTVLDVGCGTGINLQGFTKRHTAFGLDASFENLRYCRGKGLERLSQGDAVVLPYTGEAFDMVAALEMVEHIDDDLLALQEMHRVLKSRGVLVLTVPAYQFLFSPYADTYFGHKRRYTAGMLGRLVRDAGFSVERISYFNTFLFPLMVFVRIHEKLMKPHGDGCDVVFKRLPGLLNSAFATVLGFEADVLSLGLNMPFGGSIICIATKQ